ncbi:MAG: hypothetical protein A2X96_01755 [Syntrophobacterales bacterium GWC2_56_13]|nr:MAG: hypothetical protein A2X96_01755 [Syntrophobacterales bacterium GWC2_56_13]OHE20535.1 MAG: hypothetical protein A2X95_09690 [Syntrophobacterales bacterium GWF2_56_9]
MNSLSIDSIWERIEAFIAPQGPTPEGWCYDLLLAGTVSLTKTKTLPVALPDAYNAYRNPSVLRHLTGPEYDAFAWGFYLNSAIHRVIWAMERLLRIVASMDSGKLLLVRAAARKKCTSGTPALKAVLDQFNEAGIDLATTPVSGGNVLHILYERVNRQKHWTTRSGDLPTRGNSRQPEPWGQTAGEKQYQLVLEACALIIALYRETVKV